MKKTGILIIAGLTMMVMMAHADSYWGSASGNYMTPASWQFGGVPGAGDTAWFTNNASYTVTVDDSATIANATFDAPGGGMVTLDAGVHTWNNTGSINIGPSATAATTVRLDGGNYLANSIQLTNVTLPDGVGTSFLELTDGTLTTTGDSEIRMALQGSEARFEIGENGTSSTKFTWRITGGTTKLYTPGPSGENQSALYVGRFNQYGHGILEVTGSSTVLTNLTNVYVGDASWGNKAHSLSVSNGAKVYVGGQMWVGRSCFNNQVVVDGDGSLLQVASSLVLGKNGNGANWLTVTNGGSVECASFGIEEGGRLSQLLVTGTNSSFYSAGQGGVGGAGGATSNTLAIADGASFYNGGNMQFGKSATLFSPGNEILVTGTGSTFTNMGNISYDGSNQTFRVTDGGLAYFGGNFAPASTYGLVEISGSNSVLSGNSANLGGGMSLVVTNGGAFESRSGSVYVGSSAGAGASILVSGSGSTYTATGNPSRIANVSDARITVENGGQFTLLDDSNWGLVIGYAVGKTGTVVVAGANTVFDRTAANYGAIKVGEAGVGHLVITNQSTFTYYSRSGVIVGDAAGAAGSTLLVADGAQLDWRRQPDASVSITVGDFAGNTVTNRGGIFQFAYPAPVVTPGAFGRVVIDGGTVSFKDIDNADIRCNQAGFGMASTDKVQWLGANTFRLNAATNVANVNQAYTFAVTGDPANFATLSLINGAEWRGGTATIGSGGALAIDGGTNALSADLTFEAGSSMTVVGVGPNGGSHLVASGAVTLGGTLNVTLNGAPVKDVEYDVISTTGGGSISGSFANSVISVSYAGVDYDLNMRYGDGVSVVWATVGTVITVR
ncbi:MAG: hypothetical protein HQ523_05515 [Lentisphaerae bacterium]|nr:hypothetical protein [Lentisphaerota bacterium]